MSAPENTVQSFTDLGLAQPILDALQEVGYETPSPIQAETIPHLLEGKDVIGQAQTGTGKTAAFSLPLLSRIDLKRAEPQLLILAPTRELAIQVAEACQKYSSKLKGFHVAPIYGGQSYDQQIRQLKRGVHVVVGTPGRVMDHMRRGTLKLGNLQALVLDEADEMLRMGFIDDVEWILEQTPSDRQIALFSATMPPVIRKIAEQHLNNPTQISIKVKTTTAATIRQRYWMVSGLHKLDALTRLLEAETFDGMIIFVRTKNSAVELAEKLQARGFAAAELTGDMAQNMRERTVNQIKSGGLDILVATDVVARGLDVERITHVINYDIPYDTESYTHRIGRTGRAGREGDAILFVAPREKRILHTIERATRQKIEPLELPSTEAINDIRVQRFCQRITDTLNQEDFAFYTQLVENYQQEHNIPATEIAAALAKMVQGDEPLLLKDKPVRARKERDDDFQRDHKPRDKDRGGRSKGKRESSVPEEGMVQYRLEVGRDHNVSPKNIVGAIANEAGLDSQYIGRIQINGDHSFVDLPDGMPKDVFEDLCKAKVCGRPLKLSPAKGAHDKGPKGKDSKGKDQDSSGDIPMRRQKSGGGAAKRAKDKPKKLKHRGKK